MKKLSSTLLLVLSLFSLISCGLGTPASEKYFVESIAKIITVKYAKSINVKGVLLSYHAGVETTINIDYLYTKVNINDELDTNYECSVQNDLSANILGYIVDKKIDKDYQNYKAINSESTETDKTYNAEVNYFVNENKTYGLAYHLEVIDEKLKSETYANYEYKYNEYGQYTSIFEQETAIDESGTKKYNTKLTLEINRNF